MDWWFWRRLCVDRSGYWLFPFFFSMIRNEQVDSSISIKIYISQMQISFLKVTTQIHSILMSILDFLDIRRFNLKDYSMKYVMVDVLHILNQAKLHQEMKNLQRNISILQLKLEFIIQDLIFLKMYVMIVESQAYLIIVLNVNHIT